MKSKSKSRKGSAFEKFMALTPTERKRASAKYDQEMVIEESRPLTKKERADFEGFQKKMGRPLVGKGAIRVSVSIERGLLEAADKAAKKAKLKRSELIDKALRKLIQS